MWWREISRTFNGLASGIKIAAVSLQTSVGDNIQKVTLPIEIEKYLISYCWILSCKVVRENTINVCDLRQSLLDQYAYLIEKCQSR